MSKVERDGNGYARPAWNYVGTATGIAGVDLWQLEMLESIRNAIEALQQSQMLQCDVAHAIKAMARDIHKLRTMAETKTKRRRSRAKKA